MKQLLRQISITTSIIALIATIVGATGLYNEWELSKSLNIISSGITGLVISASIAITAYSQNGILRFFQIILSVGLIFITTRLGISNVIYYVICFQLLWLVTLAMTISTQNKLGLASLTLTTIVVGIAYLIGVKSVIYAATFILLITSGLFASLKTTDQSK